MRASDHDREKNFGKKHKRRNPQAREGIGGKKGKSMKTVDLKTIIGVYQISNTGAILVHAIDYTDDLVCASLNGKDQQWCKMCEQDIDGVDEFGFMYGEMFVPFFEVIRLDNANRIAK